MKAIRGTWVVVVLALGVCAGCAHRPGLTVGRGGVLLKEGRPFRGYGVNCFDAFSRTLKNPNDRSYDAAFEVLGRNGIPFVRLMGCGYWPKDMKLYREDREEYFRRLDGVVRSAERNGVGLILCLFWHVPTFSDLAGESCDQWGNERSRTHEFMRQYVKEVVLRYRNSPGVWGWEFSNETNLSAGLPEWPGYRPPIVPTQGTPTTRSSRDQWSGEMMLTAYRAFAREVRRYDPHRMISSGCSIPRKSAWHDRAGQYWKPDSAGQFAEMMGLDNPDPMDVVSVHIYKVELDRLPAAAEVARKMGKPLFVGEFGVSGAASEESRGLFFKMMELMEKEQVALAAVWTFSPGQGAYQEEWTVTADNPRSYQFKAIVEANRRIREYGAGSQEKTAEIIRP